MARRIRVLISRLGLDAHWTGSTVIAKALTNAGMEVIYGGSMQPAEIAKCAEEENVDVIGLSTLCGNHLALGPKVIEALQEMGIDDDSFVVMGGTIFQEDTEILKKAGIREVFGPGSNTDDIVEYIENQMKLNQRA